MFIKQFEKVKNLLPKSYKPYPFIDDRNFWDNVSKTTKTAYIKEAEMYMKSGFPILSASTFMEFYRNGNRSNYQADYSNRRKALNVTILAELFENKGRFLDFIVDIIWMLCEETTWIIPAHNCIGGYKHIRLPLPDLDRPIIDLMSADTAASIAIALYFFKDKFEQITPQICNRAEYELNRRIIKPYRDHTDYWWMGFMGDPNEQLNNWNPWINSNMLLTLLLTEKNTNEVYYILHKIIESLDAYIKSYPEDGGCDEGPGYWGRAGASFFECLEIIYEYTDGAVNIYDVPKIKNMCDFIRWAHIKNKLYVNFADASPTAVTDPALIYRFGKAVNSLKAMTFGALQQQDISLKDRMLGRFGLNRPIREFTSIDEINNHPLSYTPEKSVFLDDIEVAYLRCNTDKGELFAAVKGGNNCENHNHNDVGNFVIYGDGVPFVIDTGNMVYTKKTFSPQRYDIWSNCSTWHNTPDINGTQQLCGKEYKAESVSFNETSSTSALSVNLQNAYPKDSGINRWTRNISMDRDKFTVTVKDSFELSESTDDVNLRIMTHPEPVITGDSVILESEGLKLKIDFSDNLTPEYEKINLDDLHHKRNWGDNLYRLSFKIKQSAKSGSLSLKFKLI